MVSLKRSLAVNSVTGICITKLDVLDGLDSIKICTGYLVDGEERSTPPVGADALARCQPVYLELPGWSESTVGVTSLDALPVSARAYLDTIERLSERPIDLVSTGPDRIETLIRRHPFDV